MNRLLAVLLVLVNLAGLARVAQSEILAAGSTRASDALPLYLAAAAVADGLDPTLQKSLETVYDARQLDVGAATFSNLYPASAGVLLQPVALVTWDTFETAWRWLLLAAVASFGLSAGLTARSVTWGAAVGASLAWHPLAAEGVRLGQVNMVLGALSAGAIAALAHRRDALAGILCGLGGLIKLVPGAMLLPLLAARRYGAAGAILAVGALGGALTLLHVPLGRTLDGIAETLAFQSAIDPDWLVGDAPVAGWMRVIGYARHDALQWIALGAAVIVPWLRPSRATAMAGIGVLCGWLGADAAGFHVLYAPLAWPVIVLVAGARLPSLVAVGSLWALYLVPFGGLGPEPRMVLWGLVATALAGHRLFSAAGQVMPAAVERDRSLRQASVATAGVLSGMLIAAAQPGEGPVAAPLPEGATAPEGAGFIHAGDRAPGSRGLGAGADRAASTLVRAGTVRDVQLYMKRAPLLWNQLAERYPARADTMRARAREAPTALLRDLSGREAARYLRDEQETVTTLQAEGLALGELPGLLDAAWRSGLGEIER